MFSKILSFVWPVTKKVTSKINGDLEITWYQGKKRLDTKNANYSYGSLDVVWRYILDDFPVKSKDKILILGLGGGNLVKLLYENFSFNDKIIAIEIDEVVIEIAKNEFDIKEQKKLRIICQDALKYVKNTKQQFDYIFIDIFVDDVVPDAFFAQNFWINIKRILNKNGRFAFNAGINSKSKTQIENLVSFLKNNFNIKVFEKVNATNTLVVGEKSSFEYKSKEKVTNLI